MFLLIELAEFKIQLSKIDLGTLPIKAPDPPVSDASRKQLNIHSYSRATRSHSRFTLY